VPFRQNALGLTDDAAATQRGVQRESGSCGCLAQTGREDGRLDPRVRPAAICALGWRSGDRLILTAAAWVVVAPRQQWDGGPAIAGDLVLLAAVPGEDALAAYPIAVADEALGAHAVFPRADGSTT
jgi:hypothetical protein